MPTSVHVSLRRSALLLATTFVALGLPSVARADLFEETRDPRPYGEGVAVAALAGDGVFEARIGHLSLRLTDGVLHPLRTASDRQIGWYFRGHGTYLYRSEDPADGVILAENLRRLSRQLRMTGDVVTDGFRELLILTAGVELDGLAGRAPAAAGASPAPAEVVSRFDAMWSGVELGDLEFDHYATAIEANGFGDQYAYVEIVGELERVGYSFDRHRRMVEQLVTFRKFHGVDYRFREYVSQQVLPERGRTPIELTLEHADLRAVTPDNRTGTVSGRLRLRSGRDGLRIALLYLTNNRDPDSARWQSEKKALTITRLTDAAGTPLVHSHRYDELLVDFGRPLAAGETVELDFAADAAIFTDAGGEYVDNYRDLYGVYWFPTPAVSAGRRFTFELEVRCEPPFYPVATGDTTFEGQEDGLNVLRTRSEVPVEDIATFLGKYTLVEKVFGDLTVRVHGYGLSRKSDLESMASVAAMFTDYYGTVLGAYPHRELDLVEIPTFRMYGISPAGLIVLTSASYEPSNVFVRQFLGNRGVNALIAHEVAHQWFGHREWPRDPYLDNWLTESFAEYLSGLAMGVAERTLANDGKNRGRVKGFKALHTEWWRSTRDVASIGTIRGANRLSGALAPFHRIDLLYSRGPLVLHQFRTLVGEQRFFEILRRFLDEADYGPTDTADLARIAGQVVGQDMSWYFDQWLDQKGIPEIAVSYDILTEGGTTVLAGQVRQTGAEFYKLHVPLILQMPDNRTEVRLVFQEQPTQEFRFELPARPSKVLVDPAGNNLADYR